MTAIHVSDCTGLWRRTLLVDADGSHDTTTDVLWLQGITAFVDLRRPVPRNPAAQDGFAGWLHQDGDVFEWTRFTGLQPEGEHPDAGRMHWDGDVLVETGIHADYIEHWMLEPATGQCWALTLAGPGGSQALLLRAGGRFGWATRTADGAEISLGTVSGPRWTITDSSDSARDGADLAPRLNAQKLTVAGDAAWTVTDSEGEVTV